MTTIIPLQRTLLAMSPCQREMPTWIEEATLLERAGISQYASQEMEGFGALSPLESLIGGTIANTDRQRFLFDNIRADHPLLNEKYLTNVVFNKWSLGTDSYWRTLPVESQLLIVRYAAITRNVLRPQYSGQAPPSAVADVLRSASDNIRNDPMLQSIIACNNPRLIDCMIRCKDPLSPQALAFGFLNRPEQLTHAAYDTMDDNTFVALTMYDKTVSTRYDEFQRKLNGNRTLQRYPWDKLPLIFEHHPARFIQSVVTSPDVANAHTHVKRWFIPMLNATAQRAANDPGYARMCLDSVFSRKRFDSTMERHAPDAYAVLNLTRQLYGPDASGTDEPAVRAWLNILVAQQHRLNETFLNVNANVFSYE